MRKRRYEAQLVSSTDRSGIYSFHRILLSSKWLYHMETETKPQSAYCPSFETCLLPCKILKTQSLCNTLNNPTRFSLLSPAGGRHCSSSPFTPSVTSRSPQPGLTAKPSSAQFKLELHHHVSAVLESAKREHRASSTG